VNDAPAIYPRRGEIWSVELPNQPTDPHTPRPALVLSIDVRNNLAGDVLVVPLSTRLRPLPTHVLIPAGAGGQRHDSMAKCEQITTLDKRFLVRGPYGARVPAALLDQVVRAVRRATGDAIP
jgi:mRNA interferase MazF